MISVYYYSVVTLATRPKIRKLLEIRSKQTLESGGDHISFVNVTIAKQVSRTLPTTFLVRIVVH